MENLVLEKKQCLIAGDGFLPIELAKKVKENGLDLVIISLSSDNKKELQKIADKFYVCWPGEVKKIRQIIIDEGIKQVSFIGKVSKSLIVKSFLKLDKMARDLLKKALKLNDDAVMLLAVEELRKVGAEVLDQTIFIKHLMVSSGVLGAIKPTPEQLKDIEYGYETAKNMGKLDIGQSVVVKNKMIMAVEAIEGTDKCIVRGCRLARKGAVVVKVAKPSQDKRFDIPAVGLKTLKKIRHHKGSVLAVEAGETIMIDKKEVIEYANKHNIAVVAV